MQELPGPDQMLADVIQNIKLHGICEHFAVLFREGRGTP